MDYRFQNPYVGNPYYAQQAYMQPMQDNLAQLRNNQYQQTQMMQQPVQPQQQQNTDDRIWVQGEVGAKAYLVAMGNTVTLWDSESQTIYLKSNINGVPAMQKLTYLVENQPSRAPLPTNTESSSIYITRDEFERRMAEIANIKKEVKQDDEQK